MKLSTVAAMLFSVVGLVGCATGDINTGYPFPVEAAAPVSNGPAHNSNHGPIRQSQVDLVALLQHALGPPVKTSASLDQRNSDTLDKLVDAADRSPDNLRIRNVVVGEWMNASEANCVVYLQALRSSQVVSRLGFDAISGGLAGAASIATPPASAKILSMLSALAIAEGSSVDRNIFAEQGAEIVADAIEQLRSEDLVRLNAHLKQNYSDWPLPIAMRDLFAYHGDCSMLRGFTKLRNAVIARESDIQNMRSAAAAVEKANGTGPQVSAVVAAFESANTSGVSAISLTPTPVRAWSGDIDTMMLSARSCLANMTPDAVKAANNMVCPAQPPTENWADTFNMIVSKVLTANSGQLSTDLLNDATATKADKTDAWNTHLNAALSQFDSSASATASALTASRAGLATALGTVDASWTADRVVVLITTYAGLEPTKAPDVKKKDPAMQVALAAASSINGVSANAAAAAAAAVAAAQAYVAQAGKTSTGN